MGLEGGRGLLYRRFRGTSVESEEKLSPARERGVRNRVSGGVVMMRGAVQCGAVQCGSKRRGEGGRGKEVAGRGRARWMGWKRIANWNRKRGNGGIAFGRIDVVLCVL